MSLAVEAANHNKPIAGRHKMYLCPYMTAGENRFLRVYLWKSSRFFLPPCPPFFSGYFCCFTPMSLRFLPRLSLLAVV